MKNDPGILCFQHTKCETKIFCFEFPQKCKFCSADLLNTELEIPPFMVPYPFRNSSKEYNSVVIKPTSGDFLNDYENSSDLHIGVTDSQGFVVEYDVNGLRRSKGNNWEQCLPIQILQPMTLSLQSYWDEILFKTTLNICWKPERYNTENHNCYSFVLSFLRSLKLKELDPYVTDKVVFCKYFVTPQARIAAKYISLFRHLKRHCI